MPTICHFEIPADDLQRAKAFYEKLFNWKFNPMPEMDYYGIKTGPDNSLGGGMMKRQNPQHSPVNYMDVDNVDNYSEQVKKLGGQVIMGKTPVPGMGWFAVCLDTENNPFGLWEVDKEAK